MWREDERDCEGFGGKNKVSLYGMRNLIEAAGFSPKRNMLKIKKKNQNNPK